MKNQRKSDKNLSRILTGGLFILTGLLIVITWPKLFDIILFKVSRMLSEICIV